MIQFNNKQEEDYWILQFTTIYGWQFHPGAKDQLTAQEAALYADAALEHFRIRKWHSSQASSAPASPSAATSCLNPALKTPTPPTQP